MGLVTIRQALEFGYRRVGPAAAVVVGASYIFLDITYVLQACLQNNVLQELAIFGLVQGAYAVM